MTQDTHDITAPAAIRRLYSTEVEPTTALLSETHRRVSADGWRFLAPLLEGMDPKKTRMEGHGAVDAFWVPLRDRYLLPDEAGPAFMFILAEINGRLYPFVNEHRMFYRQPAPGDMAEWTAILARCAALSRQFGEEEGIWRRRNG